MFIYARTFRSQSFLYFFCFAFLAQSVHAETDIDYREDVVRYANLNAEASQLIRSINRSSTEQEKRVHLERLATTVERGSAWGAFYLGYMHLSGMHGVPADADTAVALLDQAVREEQDFMLLGYGLILVNGERIPADPERGHALVQRAAELGNGAAQLILAEDLLGAGGEIEDEYREAWNEALHYFVDSDQSLEYSAEAFEANVANAYAYLSHLLMEGYFVAEDALQAEDFLDMVDPEFLGPAMADIAFMLSQTHNLWVDQRAAIRYYAMLPDDTPPWVINNYCWLLATALDPELRDGETAVALMEPIVAENPDNVSWVDTLAAAYAADGQFESAVETQTRALEMFDEQGPEFEDAQRRLELFKEGAVWRD